MFIRVIIFCAALSLCGNLLAAQTPSGIDRASADTPDGALVCAATRFRGEPLSIEREDGMFELGWLTPSQNVLRIKLRGPGCQFVEVRGVGLSEARIMP